MPARRSSAAHRTNALLKDIQSNAHRTNVLLEDVQSKFEIVLEAVISSRDYLDRKFEARFVAIEERLSNLEFAVKQNSKDILALREDLNQLRRDFEHRQELQRIAALERRVEALERTV
jgi:predicted  nucleic acid-binding Zn-ribbon protein